MNKLFYGDNPDVLRKFIRDGTVDPFLSHKEAENNIAESDSI